MAMIDGIPKLNQPTQESDSDKRKKMIDEIYGYTEEQTGEEKQKKSELMDLFNSYVEHRKSKMQKPLGTMLGGQQ
jgi:hypothetical protein